MTRTLIATLGTGHVSFRATSRGVDVTTHDVCVLGMTDGKHGFHIHEHGDTTDGCASMGAHYDPHRSHRHGGLSHADRHAGDLENVISRNGCLDNVTIRASNITLDDIIGRGIVLHEREDDLGQGGTEESHTTGSAGARIACGRIKVSH